MLSLDSAVIVHRSAVTAPSVTVQRNHSGLSSLIGVRHRRGSDGGCEKVASVDAKKRDFSDTGTIFTIPKQSAGKDFREVRKR